MTTIAYRDGVLASDTRVCLTDGMIVTDTAKKLHRFRDGRLYGYAGSVEQGVELFQELKKADNIDDIDGFEGVTAIIVNLDGSLWMREGSIWIKQERSKAMYYAIGSGCGYALAAMDAGACAKRAVEIAIKRDNQSGGNVKTMTLKGTK